MQLQYTLSSSRPGQCFGWQGLHVAEETTKPCKLTRVNERQKAVNEAAKTVSLFTLPPDEVFLPGIGAITNQLVSVPSRNPLQIHPRLKLEYSGLFCPVARANLVECFQTERLQELHPHSLFDSIFHTMQVETQTCHTVTGKKSLASHMGYNYVHSRSNHTLLEQERPGGAQFVWFVPS